MMIIMDDLAVIVNTDEGYHVLTFGDYIGPKIIIENSSLSVK